LDLAERIIRLGLVSIRRGIVAGTGLGAAKPLPALLSCKPFIQKRQYLRDIELDILQIKIFEVVLLHLKEIIKFEIEFQQSTSPPYDPC